LPGLRSLFQKIFLTRLTSIMQTLLAADVPIIEALNLTRDAVGNKVYERILGDTSQAIKDGANMSQVWEQEAYMPVMLTTMVAVGERSGEVERSFKQANSFFKRDVDEILATLSVLIEPVLIIILGIGVGFIVAAVILPIYNLVVVI
jgi:type II secretory pathway component PulF